MFLYIVLIIFLLSKIGLWDTSQLKTTILWALTTAGVSFSRVTSASDDQEFFRNSLKDIFKITLAIEFVVAFYPFSLIAELLFLPFMAFVGFMVAFARGKDEHQAVERFFNGVLVCAGLLIMGYSGYRLIYDPQDFFTLSTLKDFYLPPLLSFLFLPYVFFLVMYIAYEKAFFLVDIHVKNKSLRNVTKRHALIGFVSDRELLRRWSQTLVTNPIKEKTDVAPSIERTFELKRREENPPNVSFKDGWSPDLSPVFPPVRGRVRFQNVALCGRCVQADRGHAPYRLFRRTRPASPRRGRSAAGGGCNQTSRRPGRPWRATGRRTASRSGIRHAAAR